MTKRFDIHEWQAKQRLVEQDEFQKRQDRLTPGKNPDEFYGDGSLDKLRNSDAFGSAGTDKRTGQVISDILQLIRSTDIDPMDVMEVIGEEFKIKFEFSGGAPGMKEVEVTGMEPDSGNMEKEFNVIGPANLSDPLTDVTIEYNKQEYILDFEFGDVIDDHGSSGRDEWYEATAEDGTIFRVDVYMVHQEGTPEPQWKTLEITPSDDPRMDPAIRSDFDDPKMEEQNTLGKAGSGASFKSGNSMAHMSNRTSKKKKK
tara:strand:+ start:2818 stop:3588 length:771 start_codon:yes stop_codon:yes gene_type:complete